MIKALIAVDLDGTLLDKNGAYSASTRDYLRALAEKGYMIVPASGRPFRSMEWLYRDLLCFGPVIVYNGALVFHPLKPNFPRQENRFPKSKVLSVYEKAKDFVPVFLCEAGKKIYATSLDTHLDRYFPFSGMECVEGDLSVILDSDVDTCLFGAPVEEHDHLRRICEEEGLSWRSWSHSIYSELYHPLSHKGTALEFIMREYGLSKEHVYAFGDAENDIPMLDVAGHPFAMKQNKVPHLLARFPSAKNSVDEDGVMNTLQALLTH